MIRAIIFDFFGVLATEGVTGFKNEYIEEPDKRSKIDSLVNRLNMAEISFNDFIEKLAAISGRNMDDIRSDLDTNKPNSLLLKYIRKELKPKYKIGMISNAGGDYIYDILPGEDIDLFDNVVLSYKFGKPKPHPDIYIESLKNLGVQADETVFIDDIRRYCEAAKKIGMKFVWYQDFQQMKSELEKILTAVPDN